MRLFTTILPILQYHIRTGYGVSKEYYRRKDNPTGRTRQEIKLSGDICRDKYYLFIKLLEIKKLGCMIKTPIIK